MRATLLRVNLSNGKVSKEPIAEAVVRQFIGGRGLATTLLADSVDTRIDPFDPAKPLIFATGKERGKRKGKRGKVTAFTFPLLP
jgi:aldehyde:ferredoxin oxidoreductase